MVLEDYFDFQTSNDIRIKGSRIGIETVLYEYIHRSQTPEEIAAEYSTVTLEQVYATILYYLRNEEAVDKYLEEWIEFGRQAREQVDRDPPDYLIRLRAPKAERQRAGAGEGAGATG